MTTVILNTNKGDITLELDESAAPVTVANFLRYVDEGFYDGLIFHRVIPGFMIQGGGFTPEMEQRDTHEPIKNEAANGLKNEKYAIAMARTPEIHSDAFLDFRAPNPSAYGYAVFGRVTAGFDTVDAIEQAPTGTFGYFQDVPHTPVVIHSATRVRK